ncbi:hypothetical protein A3SI_00460 [Nitritalea halalkaliphila LW7]|uniref:Uncharacterized protein n=1 Tax=Nitritalea halalkaliphila LW7 TaxID=1189621 RepID=I5CAN8_9BACT|nr:hypothetical protein [Nitritalea halalkaliphila]EIM78890.1 hypothetical protein A3SI_00460 [Nitritalea halalkaliphila LW7]
MQKKPYFSILALLGMVLSLESCSPPIEQDAHRILQLELTDSLCVETLAPLLMDDFLPEKGLYLLKGDKSRLPLLVDQNGDILQEYAIGGDGPNSVGPNGAFGYRFLGEDAFVAQGFYTDYHIFGLDGQKQRSIPFNAEGLFGLTLYKNRTTFHPLYKNGQAFLVGEEPNSFNPATIDKNKLGAAFYEQARTIYAYNLETAENQLLETYPESWEPRANKRFVGESVPLLAWGAAQQEIALLPRVGNQLFLYDFSGETPILRQTVALSHPERPADAPTLRPEDSADSDYPQFSDIRYAGAYIIIQFFTQVPKGLLSELKAQFGEPDYLRSPEFREARQKYVRPYFIVVREGEQVGILNEVPVSGSFNFSDASGILYFNDNLSPAVERDYNVFYKLRIVAD